MIVKTMVMGLNRQSMSGGTWRYQMTLVPLSGASNAGSINLDISAEQYVELDSKLKRRHPVHVELEVHMPPLLTNEKASAR